MGFGRKKDALAREREEFLRAAFREMVMSSIDSERMVFLRRSVRRTPRWRPYTDGGESASGSTRRRRLRATNWGKNVTLLSFTSPTTST
jgi:hypothetical protein